MSGKGEFSFGGSGGGRGFMGGNEFRVGRPRSPRQGRGQPSGAKRSLAPFSLPPSFALSAPKLRALSPPPAHGVRHAPLPHPSAQRRQPARARRPHRMGAASSRSRAHTISQQSSLTPPAPWRRALRSAQQDTDACAGGVGGPPRCSSVPCPCECNIHP